MRIVRVGSSILCAALCATVISGSAGCSRGASVVGKAEASVTPAPPVNPELATVRAIAGNEDEEDAPPKQGQLGAKRWRDTGVYVDGKPMGALTFGELPIALAPTWKDEPVSVPIEPGHKGPGFKVAKQRYYKFTDYLKAIGVDLAKVKEIHIYGPKFSETIVASGAEMRKRSKEFLFHFGGEVMGKAIPAPPRHFGNGRSPDKISAVMVYIDKKPPTLVWNQGLALDGKIITDVPYYGAPLRGGVRVYQDDQLAMVIKRPLLRQTEPATRHADGTAESWKLPSLLEANGVDGGKIAEGWLIYKERRTERLSREQLAALTFQMGSKGQNEIFLGDQKLPANAIALHAKALRPDQLPKILPDEEF